MSRTMRGRSSAVRWRYSSARAAWPAGVMGILSIAKPTESKARWRLFGRDRITNVRGQVEGALRAGRGQEPPRRAERSGANPAPERVQALTAAQAESASRSAARLAATRA